MSTPSPPWSAEDADALCFVTFDFETTGPNPVVDEIIQIGAVCVGDGFGRLVRPVDRRITPGATAVHGLTDDHVRGAAPFGQVWAEFLAFLRGHSQGARHVIFVGHNSWTFDDPMLAAELQRHGLPDPEASMAEGSSGPRVWSTDTMRAARVALPPKSPLRLSVLRERYLGGAPMEDAHDALADARAVADVAPHVAAFFEYRPFRDAYEKLAARHEKAAAKRGVEGRGGVVRPPSASGEGAGHQTEAVAALPFLLERPDVGLPGRDERHEEASFGVPSVTVAAVEERLQKRPRISRIHRCAGCGTIYHRAWAHVCVPSRASEKTHH